MVTANNVRDIVIAIVGNIPYTITEIVEIHIADTILIILYFFLSTLEITEK